MTLNLVSAENVGEADRERIIFRAEDEFDLGEFVVLLALKSPKKKPFSGSVPHCYWFTDLKVKKGDTVVLYTKSGKRSEKKNENGSTSYFFYWGLDEPKLQGDRLIPVLIKSEWWDYPENVHTHEDG